MKKLLLSTLLLGYLHAGLINAVALTVNKEPITLYDIEQQIEQNNLSKDEAISKLIDTALYKEEIKRYNINITLLDIDNYLEKLASSNHMSLLDFKILIKQKQDYDNFIKQIKQQLKHQALVKKIAQGNLKIVTDEDMKVYYENHKNQYTIANKIDVIAYASDSKEILEELKSNPMLNDSRLLVSNMSFSQDELTADLKYILNNTESNSFSTIFMQNGKYTMFFITDKKDISVIPFDKVKQSIFNNMMKEREKAYLNNYFEELKITADIHFLR